MAEKEKKIGKAYKTAFGLQEKQASGLITHGKNRVKVNFVVINDGQAMGSTQITAFCGTLVLNICCCSESTLEYKAFISMQDFQSSLKI